MTYAYKNVDKKVWIYIIFENQNFVVLLNIKNCLNTSTILNVNWGKCTFNFPLWSKFEILFSYKKFQN